MKIQLQSIGTVSSSRKELVDDHWGRVVSTICFDKDVLDASATDRLEQYSHALVVFFMNQVQPEKIVRGSRHPRNDTHIPKFGILAQRGKNRPNQIGVSYAKILKVDGLSIQLEGLDAIDGTPILDIKPCMQEFLPEGEILQPEWTHQLMKHYYSTPD